MNLIDDIATVTVPDGWTQEKDRSHLHELLGLDPESTDDYRVATELLSDSSTTLDEALAAAVESLLREDEDRLSVAQVLPSAAKVEALGRLLSRHPAGEYVALRRALIVAEFAVKTGVTISTRFVVEGEKITLFELAEAADWMASAAHNLEEAMRNALRVSAPSHCPPVSPKGNEGLRPTVGQAHKN
ncbi:MAG: hypothetical protein ABMA26_06210 [Limisphaerales bacterium]